MVFPSIGQARSRAKSVGCIANLKQLAMADIQYATDWDGLTVPNGKDVYWYKSICKGEYNLDTRFDAEGASPGTGQMPWNIIRCPESDKIAGTKLRARVYGCVQYSASNRPSQVFEKMGNIMVKPSNDRSIEHLKLSRMRLPSATLLFADSRRANVSMSWGYRLLPWGLSGDSGGAFWEIHGKKSGNAAFADGHVASMPAEKLRNSVLKMTTYADNKGDYFNTK